MFSRSLADVSGFSGRSIRLARVTWFAVREFHRDYCFERAATLAFATIISMIPFAVLLLGVAHQLKMGDDFVKYADERIFDIVAPDFRVQLTTWLTENISKDAISNSVASLVGLLALVSLLVAALGVLSATQRNFDRVWKVRGRRSYFQKLVTFWIVLTISPFIMAALLWVEDFLVPSGRIIEDFTREYSFLKVLYGFLVPATVGFVGFTVIYRYLPAVRVRVGSAMLGALFAAVLWQISRQAFYFYVVRSSSVYSLYGSLAIVPLFLIWIYLNWLIVLWGCEISYAHQNLLRLTEFMDKDTRTRQLPLRFVGVYLLERLARSFRTGGGLPGAAVVGEELAIQTEKVKEAGSLLVNAGLLAEDSRQDGGYSLLRDPTLISLSEAVSLLPSEEVPPELLAAQDVRGDVSSMAKAAGTAKLFRRARGVYLDAFRGKTLADLLEERSGEELQ